MPDNNPWGPQSFNGPFAGSITPQVVSEPHQSQQQFNGYGGKGQAVLGILDKFLAGVGQGRMQRSMAQEQQKTQFTQGFGHWANTVMADPDVPTEMKSEFEKGAVKAQMAEAAQATKGSEKTNPVLGALHKVFTGLAGGDVTKSKTDIPAMQKFMAEWEAKLHLPQNTVTGQRTIAITQGQELVNKAQEAAKAAGKPFTAEDANAAVQPLVPQFEKLLGPQKAKEAIGLITSPFDKNKPMTAADKKEAEREAADAAVDKAAQAPPAGQAPQQQPPGARPQQGAEQAPANGAPPPVRQQAAPDQAGVPQAAGQSAPPATRPIPITPQIVQAWKVNGLLGKDPHERLVDGETKPRTMFLTQEHTTKGGIKIPASWYDPDSQQSFKLNDTKAFKDTKPTATEEKAKKAEALYRETHKIPGGQKLSPSQDAASIREYAAAIEPENKSERDKLQLDHYQHRAAKDLEEKGMPSKQAKAVTQQYASSMKASQGQLDKDRNKADADHQKTLAHIDKTIFNPQAAAEAKQSADADYKEALKDAWGRHKEKLQQAVLTYDQQRKDGEHDSWADDLPDEPPVTARAGAATLPAVREKSGSGQGKQAAGGYIVGRKYGDLTYLGGDPKDKSNWK